MTSSQKSMMCRASVNPTEASFPCAYTASTSFIAAILDAVLASILITSGLLGLVRQVLGFVNTQNALRVRMFA